MSRPSVSITPQASVPSSPSSPPHNTTQLKGILPIPKTFLGVSKATQQSIQDARHAATVSPGNGQRNSTSAGPASSSSRTLNGSSTPKQALTAIPQEEIDALLEAAFAHSTAMASEANITFAASRMSAGDNSYKASAICTVLSQMKDAISTKSKRVSFLEDKLKRMEGHSDLEKKTRILKDEYEAKLARLNAEVKKYHELYKEIQEELDALRFEADKCRQKARIATERFRKLESIAITQSKNPKILEYDQMKANLNVQLTAAQDAESRLAALEKQIMELHNDVQTAHVQLEEEQKKKEEIIKQSSAQISALQGQNEELKRAQAALLQDSERAIAQLKEALSSERASKEQVVEQSRAKIAELEAKISELTSLGKGLQRDSELAIAKLLEELQTTKNERETHAKEVEVLVEKLMQAQKDQEASKATISQLEAQVEQERTSKDQAIFTLQEEISRLSEALEKTLQELALEKETEAVILMDAQQWQDQCKAMAGRITYLENLLAQMIAENPKMTKISDKVNDLASSLEMQGKYLEKIEKLQAENDYTKETALNLLDELSRKFEAAKADFLREKAVNEANLDNLLRTARQETEELAEILRQAKREAVRDQDKITELSVRLKAEQEEKLAALKLLTQLTEAGLRAKLERPTTPVHQCCLEAQCAHRPTPSCQNCGYDYDLCKCTSIRQLQREIDSALSKASLAAFQQELQAKSTRLDSGSMLSLNSAALAPPPTILPPLQSASQTQLSLKQSANATELTYLQDMFPTVSTDVLRRMLESGESLDSIVTRLAST